MNEQQMEAVEHLVKSGVFPKGLVAATPFRGRNVTVYCFEPKGIERPSLLQDFYDDLSFEDDEGEEWKTAKIG